TESSSLDGSVSPFQTCARAYRFRATCAIGDDPIAALARSLGYSAAFDLLQRGVALPHSKTYSPLRAHTGRLRFGVRRWCAAFGLTACLARFRRGRNRTKTRYASLAVFTLLFLLGQRQKFFVRDFAVLNLIDSYLRHLHSFLGSFLGHI